MLYYILFWTLFGFIIHFYIIFGTNLLTGGSTQNCCFFCLFQCFEEKQYQMESERNETFRSMIFGTNVIQRTWSGRQAINEEAMRQGARPPPSWAPRSSTDLLLPPIYIHVPHKHPGAPRNPISTAATFYTHEIPSWCPGAPSEGESITEGFYINTIASPMMCE